MMDEELEKKLDAFEERVKAARKEVHISDLDQESATEPNPDTVRSARAGSEFLASMMAGVVLGFGIDWFFSTTPCGIIVFSILGLVSGVYRADVAMKNETKAKSAIAQGKKIR